MEKGAGMKRKIYDTLLAWKEKKARKSAVLLDGAQRVGKSYIAETFGKQEYRSYILVDFNNAAKEVKELFEYYLTEHGKNSPILLGGEMNCWKKPKKNKEHLF